MLRFHHPNRKRHLMATLPRWISTPIEDDQPDDTLADQDAHWQDEIR